MKKITSHQQTSVKLAAIFHITDSHATPVFYEIRAILTSVVRDMVNDILRKT
jgi:hypothetical protein